MKLSELKGEKAIEVLADLLEPVSRIITDDEVVTAVRNGESKITIIQKMLKGHAKDVIEVMAITEGVPVDEYEVNFMTLPSKLIELFNDEVFSQVFTSQGQKEESKLSGSVTENTKEDEN